MKIIQQAPVSHSEEAFVIENGHMQATVYGGVKTDRIDLSENTFYVKKEDAENCSGTSTLMGWIEIEHQEIQEELPITDYERNQDPKNGLVRTVYHAGESLVETCAFASYVHNIIAYEVKSGEKPMSLRLRFCSCREEEQAVYHLQGIFFVCEAKEEILSEGTTGTLLCGKAAIYTDGFPQAEEDGLVIRNASRLAVYITAITDFNEPKLDKPQQILELQMKMNRNYMKLEEMKFEKILEAHSRDMQIRYKCSLE